MDKLCINTEVGFADTLVAEEFLARAGKDDPSRFEHVGARSDGERHVGVLLNKEDGGARPVDIAEDLEDVAHQHRRKAHGGFVEKHHAAPAHERPCYGQHLLLSAGERAALLILSLLKLRKDAEGPFVVFCDLSLVFSLPGGELEILHYRQVSEDAAAFRHLGHPHGDYPVRGDAAQVLLPVFIRPL